MPHSLGLIFVFFRGLFFVSRRETRKRAFLIKITERVATSELTVDNL